MNMQIKAFATLVGVSVRTLRYYDEIGLLKPARVDEQNGYRLYDEQSLLRMQEILFYRELDFSLREISGLLSSGGHERMAAFAQQKQLLILKKERLERLIRALEDALRGGEIAMDAFDNERYEQYKSEVKEKWGGTKAYAESVEKAKNRTEAQSSEDIAGMDRILGAFAVCRHTAAPDSPEAQTLVRDLQAYITAHFYTCTDEILSALGQMYVADERFKYNIDKHGAGTAAFISEAIKAM